VLITTTFLGYRAAGPLGALAATLGIFLMPWVLAAAAAQILRKWMQHPWLQNFGRGAAPAVVGLLVVTALHLARPVFAAGWPYLIVAAVTLGLALWTKIHPVVLLAGGMIFGAVYGILAG
jgi:chromate transporter